jgi:serine-type D-Ala-D-Ala carboxypeptidase/endopeptidase (penicillin-binding protein 4)
LNFNLSIQRFSISFIWVFSFGIWFGFIQGGFLYAQSPIKLDTVPGLSVPSSTGIWGISVRDMESGKELSGLNQQLSLTPASVQKMLTTAAAFSFLGSNFQFETKFYLTKSGRDWFLLVEGGWDPSFGSNLFKGFEQKSLFDSLVVFLLKNKVDRLSGVFAVHDGKQQDLIPDSWPWGDVGNYYGASVSKLSFNQNRLQLTFCTEEPGSPATLIQVSPWQSDVTWDSYVVSGLPKSGDNASIYGGLYQIKREVVGSLPPNKSEFSIQGSVAFPTISTLNQVRLGLILKGIQGLEQVGWATKELVEQPSESKMVWKSAPLSQLGSHINQISNNLMAEHLLAGIGQGSYLAGRDSVRNWLKRQALEPSLFYDDGSGLSRSNGISPHVLTQYLYLWSREAWFGKWIETLPVSGKTGTLSAFTTPKLKQSFQGKSGSIGQVKTYAGYMKCNSGKQVAIAVFVNAIPGSLRLVVPDILKTLEGIQSQY